MQRPGSFPKSDTIGARELDAEELLRLQNESMPLFRIAVPEMQSGVFPDIERPLAQPNARIDKRGGNYLIQRDCDTSNRLNAYLGCGAAEFLVSYRNDAHMLTIERE